MLNDYLIYLYHIGAGLEAIENSTLMPAIKTQVGE